MLSPADLVTRSSRSALPKLFALYVSGKIAEGTWNQIMDVFDTCATTHEEREALAEYLGQSFSESRTEIPRPEDVREFLSVVRGVA